MTLLTLDQIATELACSVRTVRRLVLPFVKVVRLGRAVRVERTELDRWIKDTRCVGYVSAADGHPAKGRKARGVRYTAEVP